MRNGICRLKSFRKWSFAENQGRVIIKAMCVAWRKVFSLQGCCDEETEISRTRDVASGT